MHSSREAYTTITDLRLLTYDLRLTTKMNDLIRELKDKAGLTDEQALKAAETMKDFIRSKVPPMFIGFVDQFLAGKAADDQDPLAL